MTYHSYKKLLRIKNGEEAVELLFKRAQKEYVKLFKEMVKQEKKDHTFEKAFPKKPKPGKNIIFDSFTKKKSIDKNIELFHRSAAILGEKNVIKTHENMFFDLLFYKFCEDYKHKI